MYYVYIWKKPGNIPFYVGIGRTEKRWNPLYARTRNPHCQRTVSKVGVDNVTVELIENLSKKEACRLEQTLIWYFGRDDLGVGPLTNMTDGGDGIQNVSEKSKKQMSESAKKQKEIRSARISGDKNPMRNPEIRAHAISRMNSPEVIAKYSGNNNPAKRPEVREKIKAKWADPEYKKEQTLKRIGRKIHSEAEIERRRQRLLDPNNPMREYHKVLNSDPDIKAKRVAAIRSPEVQEKIKAKLNDPEAKARRLAKLRATIASPEYQAKLALRKKPKPPKKTKEEISKIRSENMRKLNADKAFAEKRVTNLKAASDKISAGVIASMDKRLQTMQTLEVQAKLRQPKTQEAREKLSLSKKKWWADKKALIQTP